MSMIAVNYLACMIVGVCYTGVSGLIPNGEGVVPMLSMGAFNGVFYMLGLVLNQYNIPRNGVVLTSVFSKMGGLLIPLVISILVFREDPTMLQMVGFIVSMVSIVLICQGGEKETAKKLSIGGLAILFLSDGCAGIMAKVFQEMGNPLLSDHFLFMTFGVALILCVIVILVKGERIADGYGNHSGGDRLSHEECRYYCGYYVGRGSPVPGKTQQEAADCSGGDFSIAGAAEYLRNVEITGRDRIGPFFYCVRMYA